MKESDAVYLTAEGIEKLRRELDHLIRVRKPQVSARLRHAIQMGDLSENADYIAAKEEMGFIQGRIDQLEQMLKNAVLIENHGDGDVVALGSRVTIVEEGEEEAETFQIVGAAEADPGNGRVSNESPLGRALLGRRVGDRVVVHAPGGELVFRIIAIE